MTPFEDSSGPPYRDEHAFVRENLPAFVAGGLAEADRAAVNAHVAECAGCAAALAELEGLDASLRGIFSPVAASAAGLEDRLISHIRENAVTPRLRNVWIRRAGMGIAAAIALGATGVLADYAVKNDLLGAARNLPGKVMAAANMEWVLPGKKPVSTPPADQADEKQAANGQAAAEGDGKSAIVDNGGAMVAAGSGRIIDGFGVGWNLGVPHKSFDGTVSVANGTFSSAAPFATGVPGSLAGTASDRWAQSNLNEEQAKLAGQQKNFTGVMGQGGLTRAETKHEVGGDTDLDNAKALAFAGDQKKRGYAGAGQYFKFDLEPANESGQNRVRFSGDADLNYATSLATAKASDLNGAMTVGGAALGTTFGGYTLGTANTVDAIIPDGGAGAGTGGGSSGHILNAGAGSVSLAGDVQTTASRVGSNTLAGGELSSNVTKSAGTLTLKGATEANAAGRTENDRRVAAMFQDADTLLQQQKYSEAASTLKKVLSVDPNNNAAKLSLRLAEDTAAFRQVEELNQKQGKEFLGQSLVSKETLTKSDDRSDRSTDGPVRVNNTAGEGTDRATPGRPTPGMQAGKEILIPYSDLLVYPDDWQKQVAMKNASSNNGGTIPVAAGTATQPAAEITGAQTASAHALTAAQIAARKIIRNGVVEYEVTSFDDAQRTVSKIVEEEGGYVTATNSERLANGKMKGTMTVRCPPERLDRLVLQLRGIGELKGQQIGSTDVSKAYTDMESRLRALRVMEERMLEIIKTGKGDVKQLVEAETRLNETRTQIEQIEGEKRYYDNQIAMATLTISAFEKDIRQPAAAVETERLDMGIETDDVESRYIAARKAVEQAKGRIISSGLQRLDGDQLNAKIECRVPQDATGPLVDQLRQLGRVARYTRDKRLTTDPNSATTAPKTEVQDSTLTISLFNLATTPPRETTYMTVAVPDVHEVYRKLLDAVRTEVEIDPATKRVGPAGRVVNSGISGQRAEQMSATMLVYVRTPEFPKIVELIRSAGGAGTEVLASNIVVSADVSGTTAEKRGIQLTLQATAAVLPRDTYNLSVAAMNVRGLREQIKALDAAGKIRVVSDTFSEPNARDVTATMTIHVAENDKAMVEGLFQGTSVAETSRSISRVDDGGNRTSRKIAYQVAITSAEALAPVRETAITVEVANVRTAMDSLRGASSKAGGRETDSRVERLDNGAEVGQLRLEVPVSAGVDLAANAKALGEIKRSMVVKAPNVTETPLSREQVKVTLVSKAPAAPIVPEGKGVDATVRSSLASAAMALLASLYLLITGVLFLGPWLLLAWVVWRVIRRRKAAVVVAATPTKS